MKKNLTFSFIYLLAKSIAQSKYSPLQSTKLICTWHNTMSSKHLLRGIVGTPIAGVFIVKHLVEIQHIISIIRLVLITSTRYDGFSFFFIIIFLLAQKLWKSFFQKNTWTMHVSVKQICCRFFAHHWLKGRGVFRVLSNI